MKNEHAAASAKITLQNKIMAIILLESSKPCQEMNSKLVTECVDFLMELEGEKRISHSEIERRVSQIPFEGEVLQPAAKKLKFKALAVIAAVLAVLFMLFSAVSVAMGETPFGLLRKMPQILIEMFDGEEVDVDKFTIIKTKESIRYSSVEELVQKEKIKILSPTWLPENKEITSVWYIDSGKSEKYVLQCNDSAYGISIHLDESVADKAKSVMRKKEINGLTAYYDYLNDKVFWQADFDYNGMMYTVNAYTEEELLKIIENLKEID